LTTLSGSEFQTVGASTEKSRLAKTAVEFEERPASVRGLTAVIETERVVRAVTGNKLVSMSILPYSTH